MIVSDAHQAAARRQKRKLRGLEKSLPRMFSPPGNRDTMQMQVDCRSLGRFAVSIKKLPCASCDAMCAELERAHEDANGLRHLFALGGDRLLNVVTTGRGRCGEVRGIMSVRGAGCRSVSQLALFF